MSHQILNDIESVVGILDKHTLNPIFLSDLFKELVGVTSEEILTFLQSKGVLLTKENVLCQSSFLESQFITEIKQGRVRKTIDFKITWDSLGNILIYGVDITQAKSLSIY